MFNSISTFDTKNDNLNLYIKDSNLLPHNCLLNQGIETENFLKNYLHFNLFNEPFHIFADNEEQSLFSSSNNINIISLEEEKEGDKKQYISYDSMDKDYKNNPINIFLINSSSNIKINKIFNIKKIRKLGRIKNNSSKRGKHNKFQQDNIIRKFKSKLIRNIYNYINSSFNINDKHIYKTNINYIKTISSKYTKSISKEDNINWLNSKIGEIFSQKVSTKIVSCDNDHNEKLIKKIYKEGKEKKVISILEKTVEDMWKVYITNDQDNKFYGFETIKKDINKFRESGETDEYIKLYINIANNFKKIFEEIKPRKSKKK